jgi:hypothetical protein
MMELNPWVGGTLAVILVVIIVVSLMLAFGHRPWEAWWDENINDMVDAQDHDDPGAP